MAADILACGISIQLLLAILPCFFATVANSSRPNSIVISVLTLILPTHHQWEQEDGEGQLEWWSAGGQSSQSARQQRQGSFGLPGMAAAFC